MKVILQILHILIEEYLFCYNSDIRINEEWKEFGFFFVFTTCQDSPKQHPSRKKCFRIAMQTFHILN